MKFTDYTFPTPEANLACDEALLDLCEEGRETEILRFWEPLQNFVVVGYSNKIASVVHISTCRKNNIPILRRISGGGTVFQGRGCLNYSLFLKISRSEQLNTIPQTNRYILSRLKEGLQPIVKQSIQIQGFTDLTVNNLKFSGNAQRRKKKYILFHGTFLLYNFNVRNVEKFLKIPPNQPDYRSRRSHQKFLALLQISRKKIQAGLRDIWKTNDKPTTIPVQKINELVEKKYATDDWNLKY